MESAGQRMERYQHLVESGWLTQNEIRVLCGLSPLCDMPKRLLVKTARSSNLQSADSVD